ncbi:MAG: PIN domain-containing protein [Candidatus Desulfatibia sp.]|uniref:PIN domain-containing protein n=1 Tax=Candidatus Desulfatibia sp. TaxID=3101189 RepID=UPI002F312A31
MSNQQVLDWLGGQDEIFLSVVTVEEIYGGLSKKNANKKMGWFEKFILLRCHILPVAIEIARHCGILRGQFLQKGTTRTQADLLIAATAIKHNLALSTRNERDFENCGIPLLNPFSAGLGINS